MERGGEGRPVGCARPVLLSLPSPGDPYVFKLGSFQPRVSRRLTCVLLLVALGWMVLRNLPAWPLHPLG